MNDTIEIRGLRAMGRHGVLDSEKENAQPFEIDLDVESDFTVAARTDALEDTVDYALLAVDVQHIIETESFVLLEALAERIATTVLLVPGVLVATVVVRKLRPPVEADVATVGVRIRRSRKEPGR